MHCLACEKLDWHFIYSFGRESKWDYTVQRQVCYLWTFLMDRWGIKGCEEHSQEIKMRKSGILVRKVSHMYPTSGRRDALTTGNVIQYGYIKGLEFWMFKWKYLREYTQKETASKRGGKLESKFGNWFWEKVKGICVGGWGASVRVKGAKVGFWGCESSPIKFLDKF